MRTNPRVAKAAPDLTKRFTGKTVLVTGAASGLGREMVRRFALEGARVIGADLKDPAVPFEASDGAIFSVRCDVSQPGEVTALFADCARRLGRLDIVCNNA